MSYVFPAKMLEKYADVMIWALAQARKGKTGKIKAAKYENVLVRFHEDAIPLVQLINRKLLEQRWNVVLRQLPNPVFEKDYFAIADDKQLASLTPGEVELYENLGGYIYINAPSSLTHLKDVPPAQMSKASIAMRKLWDIRNRREDKGLFSWTLCTYPTEELARQAGLSLEKYAEQIAKACLLNEKDPVARWTEVYKESHEIRDWMSSLPIDTIHMESKSMDITIKQGERRSYKGCSGHNVPSFEIFTSPDWRGTSGVYFADQKSFRNGNIAEGIRLEFKNGRAVRINAKKGEAFVKATLGMDEGACQIGEFSLTDRRFSKIDRFMANTLFDENFGGKFGNSHIAVGSSYADTFDGDPSKLTPEMKKKLGFNNSALHWDLVNTEDKVVTATLKNGKKQVIYEHGEFKY